MSRSSNTRNPNHHWPTLRRVVVALGAIALAVCASLGVGGKPARAADPTVMFTRPTLKTLTEGSIAAGDSVSWVITVRLDDLQYGGLSAITSLSISDTLPKTVGNVKGALYLNDSELHNDWGTLVEPDPVPDAQSDKANKIEFTFNPAGISALKAKGSNSKTIDFHITGEISSKLKEGDVVSHFGIVRMNETTQDTYTRKITLSGEPAYTLSKDANKTQAKKGETVSYTLSVANTGEGDGRSVVIEDAPGDGLTLSGGTIKVNGLEDGSSSTIDESARSSGKVKVTVPLLKQSDDFTITYDATVSSEGSEGTTLENSATLSDEKHRTQTAEKSVTLVAPGLSIEKSATQETVNEGEKVDYTLTVKNTSTLVAAANVVVTDAPPAGLTIDTSSAQVQGADGSPQVSATESSLKVEIESIPAQKTVTITYQATVQKSAEREKPLTSSASVKADGIPQVSSESSGGGITILTTPHFEFTLTGHAPEEGTASVGSTVSFDVSITNDTPHPINQVKLSNPLPTGLVLTKIPEVTTGEVARAAVGSDVQVDDATLTVSVPELASSDTIHFSYNAIVTEEAANSITNTATVSAQGAESQDQSFSFNVTRESTPLPQTGLPPVMGLLIGGGALSGTALGVTGVVRAIGRGKRNE